MNYINYMNKHNIIFDVLNDIIITFEEKYSILNRYLTNCSEQGILKFIGNTALFFGRKQFNINTCVVDFYLPENDIVIECDGKYWHSLPGRLERDSLKTEIMQIAESCNLYNPRVELLFNKINDWFKNVEIIRYVNINYKTLPFVLKLLYEKKKRLNVEYYQRVLNTDKTIQLKIDFNKTETTPLTKFKVITNNIIL